MRDGARMEDVEKAEKASTATTTVSAEWEVLENNPNPYLNFLRQKVCKKFREAQCHGRQMRKAESHRR